MPTTPTPEPSHALAQQVEDHRDALVSLMANTGRCDDITSGLPIVGGLIGDLGGGLIGLSDRRCKRDIVPVTWSR